MMNLLKFLLAAALAVMFLASVDRELANDKGPPRDPRDPAYQTAH
jgi:hypothetical protein